MEHLEMAAQEESMVALEEVFLDYSSTPLEMMVVQEEDTTMAAMELLTMLEVSQHGLDHHHRIMLC
jgi:hypothetical protein